MFGLGGPEIAIIAVIALVLIGPTMIPRFAKGLGKSVSEFRSAGKQIADALNGKDDEK